jgi:hypothetical protein
MSIKMRIFKGDVDSPDTSLENSQMYFYASNHVRHPNRSELDNFVHLCPFSILIQEYDSNSGIGVAALDWPLASDSGDLELSTSTDASTVNVSTLTEPPEGGFKLSLSAFYDLLEAHDWYFCFAEDAVDYHAGSRDLAVICEQAKAGGDSFLYLLNEYRSYMFTGKRWGIGQMPKPQRPDGLGYVESLLADTTEQDESPRIHASFLEHHNRSSKDQLH